MTTKPITLGWRKTETHGLLPDPDPVSYTHLTLPTTERV